jgi:hypothetical protein
MGFAYSWVPKPSHGAFSLNKKKCQWCGSSMVRWSSFQFSRANLHVCGQYLLQGEGSVKLHVQQHEVPWRSSVTPLPCLFSLLSFSCLDFWLGEPLKRTQAQDPRFCHGFLFWEAQQQTRPDKPLAPPKSSSLAEGLQEFHLHSTGFETRD